MVILLALVLLITGCVIGKKHEYKVCDESKHMPCTANCTSANGGTYKAVITIEDSKIKCEAL